MRRNGSFFVACGLVVVLGFAGMAAAADSSAGGSSGGSCPCAAGECGQACCQSSCGWCAGLEGTFLKATRDPSAIALNPANVSVGDDAVIGIIPTNTPIDSRDFNSAYGVGARGWLGYQNGDGWGIRGRFWDFGDSQDVSIINSEYLFANGTYALRAYTLDLEVTKDIEAGPWSFEGALGGRYARLEQDQTLMATSTSNTESAFASRYIGGTGITGFLEARRALGDSAWSVFANVRGSVLWGNDYGAAGGTINNLRDCENSANGNTLCIFETQIGVEWTHPLQGMVGTLFVRGAYEFQRWTAADNLGVNLNSGTAFHAAPQSANVDFNGLTFAIGFRH